MPSFSGWVSARGTGLSKRSLVTEARKTLIAKARGFRPVRRDEIPTVEQQLSAGNGTERLKVHIRELRPLGRDDDGIRPRAGLNDGRVNHDTQIRRKRADRGVIGAYSQPTLNEESGERDCRRFPDIRCASLECEAEQTNAALG